MKKRTHSLLSDLAFQALLVFMFAGILFLAVDSSHLAVNGFLLCITSALLIVTYFTSLKTGLILDVVFIFLWLAYMTYQALEKGTRITANVYFWLVWPLLMLLAVSQYVKQQKDLDEENKELTLQLEKFVTIDEQTQLNNLLAFERDTKIYMNISKRYHMDLVLVLWHLTYQEDLERLLGKASTKEAIGEISDSIKKSLRGEDLVYLVEKGTYIWGTLLFSKPRSAEIVIQHVKEGSAKTDLSKYTDQKKVSLELSSAVITYDGSSMTPLSFLAKAKRRLWKTVDEEDELIESEESRHEEIKAEEIKAEEIKAEEIKAEEIKAEEIKAEEIKAEEIKAEEIKAEEIEPEGVKPDSAALYAVVAEGTEDGRPLKDYASEGTNKIKRINEMTADIEIILAMGSTAARETETEAVPEGISGEDILIAEEVFLDEESDPTEQKRAAEIKKEIEAINRGIRKVKPEGGVKNQDKQGQTSTSNDLYHMIADRLRRGNKTGSTASSGGRKKR